MGESHEMRPRSRQILEAARKCFAEHGFHGASMAVIADTAGVSVGHIYRYFANKEAVVAAIVEENCEEAAVQIAQLTGDADEIAEITLGHLHEKALDGLTALRLEILSESARNPRIAALMHDADARVRGQLRQVLLRGAAEDDADAAARIELICALYEGLAMRVFAQQGELDPALMREAKALMAQTLSAPLGST